MSTTIILLITENYNYFVNYSLRSKDLYGAGETVVHATFPLAQGITLHKCFTMQVEAVPEGIHFPSNEMAEMEVLEIKLRELDHEECCNFILYTVDEAFEGL